MQRTFLLLIAILSLATSALADGFFVAVGGINGKEADGHVREGEFGTIFTSRDGETWENVFKGGRVKENFNHANNNLLRCLAYGNGVFVAAGNSGLLWSKDGRAWQEAPGTTSRFCVEYGNGLFVAPSAADLLTSPDGVTWTKQTPKLSTPVWGKEGAGHVRKIVFGNGVFVCIGEARLSITKDGASWLHHEIFPEDKRARQQNLAFGAGRFVWLRENQPAVSSTDGLQWQAIEFPEAETGKPGSDVLWTGSEFLVKGRDCFYRSSDGVTWTKTEARGARNVHAAGNGRWIGTLWPQGFSLSPDNGKTWRTVAAEGVTARKLYFFDGKQIIGTNGG